MALIKCPECGRERVSNSAVACPDCGFAIREYFCNRKLEDNTDSTSTRNNSKKENESKNNNTKVRERKILSERDKTKPVRCLKDGSIYPANSNKCPSCGNTERTSVETQRDTLIENNQNNRNVSSDRPHFSKGYIIGIVVGVIVGLIGLPGLFESEASRATSRAHGSGDPAFQGVILIIFGIVIIGITLGIYFRGLSRYNIQKNNPELYNKMIAEETRRGQERYRAQKQAEEIRLSKLPECPICTSKTNVRRISSIDRGVSVAMVGLASSKIGKQYECTRCKHKF